jgi:hypothetical protein
MLPSTHSWLMTLRPMSHMLRVAIIPEVKRRITAGEIAADALPYQVLQFRWIQGRQAASRVRPQPKMQGQVIELVNRLRGALQDEAAIQMPTWIESGPEASAASATSGPAAEATWPTT